MFQSVNGASPKVDPTAYIVPNASIVGDVTLEEGTSVWYGAVLRADDTPIYIGKNSNIQDNATLHAGGGHFIRIGEEVSVGHNAIVHGATVGNRVIVGMNAVILDFAEIGDDCLIGAGALVTGKTVIPSGSLVLGVPAKVVRPLTEEELQSLRTNAEEYLELSELYRKG